MSSVQEQEQNPEDYLDVDTEIPNQKFCVLSFISPEHVLKKKECFLQTEFLKDLCNQTNFIQKYMIGVSVGDSDKTTLNYDVVKEAYDSFMYSNEERLESVFHEQCDFKTTVRGVKVRGVYGSHKEAEIRSKLIQRLHKRDNVFVGQVGFWLPWDPNPNHIENQEYLEPELNTLMKKYKENSMKRDEYYQDMKDESLKSRLVPPKPDESANTEQMFAEADAWASTKLNKTD
jgi:hypothetical protein